MLGLLNKAKRQYLWKVTLLSLLCLPAIQSFADDEQNHSVSLDLISQAYDLFDQGNTQGALDSFDLAIEENADALPALLGKAMVLAERQEHREAFMAFDKVVKVHPRNAFAWNGRGLAAFNLENFDEALNSFQKATVDHPVNGFYYESLAWTHMCRGEFGEATEKAKKATLMYNQKGESPAYPLLIAYFSYLEEGKRAEALRTLKYALKNKPAENTWPHPVFDFLAQKIEASDLISYVTDKSQETEAHTYIGLRLRTTGEDLLANRHFDWVSAQGDNRVFEYTLARALLNSNRATAFLR